MSKFPSLHNFPFPSETGVRIYKEYSSKHKICSSTKGAGRPQSNLVISGYFEALCGRDEKKSDGLLSMNLEFGTQHSTVSGAAFGRFSGLQRAEQSRSMIMNNPFSRTSQMRTLLHKESHVARFAAPYSDNDPDTDSLTAPAYKYQVLESPGAR